MNGLSKKVYSMYQSERADECKDIGVQGER